MGKQSRRPARRSRPGRQPAAIAPVDGLTGLRLVVATSPTDYEDGRFLAHDLKLIRSALLYADTVELLSPAAVMIGHVAALGSTDSDTWMTIMESLDDADLTHLGVEGDPVAWKETLAGLRATSNLPRAQRRRLLGRHHAELQRQIRSLEQALQAPQGALDMVHRILETAGAPELIDAVESGALTVNWDFMSAGSDTDTQIVEYTERLTSLLASPNEHLLLDQRMADLARSLITEGKVSPGELTLARAARSRLGTGLVSRLPVFPDASVQQVLEVRRGLAEPLSAYRSGVTRVSEQIRSGAFGAGLEGEISDLWRDEVAPAVARLRAELSGTRLVRESAINLGVDAKTLLSGSAMFFGVETVTDVHQAVAAAAGGFPVLAKAVASAFKESAERRGAARGHEFFYLLELENRL